MKNLHFLPQNFRFEYNDGIVFNYIATPSQALDYYRTWRSKLKAVYQYTGTGFIKISD